MGFIGETPTAGIDGSGRGGSGGYFGKESNPRDSFSDRNSIVGKSYDINLPTGTLFDFNKWENDVYNGGFLKEFKEWVETNQSILENITGGAVAIATMYGNVATIGGLIIAGTSAPIALTLAGAIAIPSFFLNGYLLGSAFAGQYNKDIQLLLSLSYSPIKFAFYTFSNIYGLNHKTSISNARNAGYIEKIINYTPNRYLSDYLKGIENTPNIKIKMSDLN